MAEPTPHFCSRCGSALKYAGDYCVACGYSNPEEVKVREAKAIMDAHAQNAKSAASVRRRYGESNPAISSFLQWFLGGS